MNHTLTAHIPQDFAGLRLDQALARLFPEYSRTQLQSWIQPPLRPKDKVQGGEEIILVRGEPPVSTGAWAHAEAGVLDIIYEDDALLVINKPPGIVVHPAAGHWNGTLVNALLHYLPLLNTLPRAGIVHRIDKDTSGLLVVAKTLQAHTALIRQLQSHKVQREYRA
ncbi:MAG: pseudouridine synthase, partial [Gammaproteobacteria bacterium]